MTSALLLTFLLLVCVPFSWNITSFCVNTSRSRKISIEKKKRCIYSCVDTVNVGISTIRSQIHKSRFNCFVVWSNWSNNFCFILGEQTASMTFKHIFISVASVAVWPSCKQTQHITSNVRFLNSIEWNQTHKKLMQIEPNRMFNKVRRRSI